MTKQEIIDKQWDWFIVQDQPFGIGNPFRSIPDEVNCMFRGVNGCRCAIGLMILDEEYDPTMESLLIDQIAARLGWGEDNIPLLRDLMGAHDNAARMGEDKALLADGIQDVASRYDLLVPSAS